MKRRAFTTILTAAAVALAMPVYAQDKGQAGARPNTGGGSSGGSAVSRPAGGGGSSSGGGSMSSPSSRGGSSASRPSAGSPGARPRGDVRPSAPQRRTGQRAVPRASSRSNGSNVERRVSPVNGSRASVSDENGDRRRAVPAYSRPRDGRPVLGTAVERTGRPPVLPGGSYYDPFYRFSYYYNRSPYGYYWPGYGLGLGYFYDPWMWGYSSPYYYGGGGGYYSGSYYGRNSYRDVGAVRLKVKPEHGQVYVDGYYVGEVDSFDGIFQKLNLEAGAHRIEIRAEGFETEQFEVMVIPGETITYKGDLKRMQ